MDWIYLYGPGIGILVGWIFGKLLGSWFGGSSGLTAGLVVLGAVWGFYMVANYRTIHKKGDTATGEFYTETKEYNKRAKKKEKQDKTTKDR